MSRFPELLTSCGWGLLMLNNPNFSKLPLTSRSKYFFWKKTTLLKYDVHLLDLCKGSNWWQESDCEIHTRRSNVIFRQSKTIQHKNSKCFQTHFTLLLSTFARTCTYGVPSTADHLFLPGPFLLIRGYALHWLCQWADLGRFRKVFSPQPQAMSLSILLPLSLCFLDLKLCPSVAFPKKWPRDGTDPASTNERREAERASLLTSDSTCLFGAHQCRRHATLPRGGDVILAPLQIGTRSFFHFFFCHWHIVK